MSTFYTIGHSNRDIATVLEMLTDAGIGLLADVRAFPGSRSNPDFNIEDFPSALQKHGIEYRHFEGLGGRRKRQTGVDDAVNGNWRVQSFHNYADYALGRCFQTALRELERLGEMVSIALMCSEAVWWRCHRRIIADYLLARDHEVVHLMAPGRTQVAKLNDGAVIRADCRVNYPMVAGV